MYEEWLTTLTIAPNTLKTRKSIWKNHVEPRWGSHHIGDIRRDAVRAWPSQMESAGVGSATIHQATTILRMICEYALDSRRIASNPVHKLKLRKPQANRHKYLTAQQVAALVSEVETGSTMVRFLAFTGLRFGEMAALRLCDVDLFRREVHVTKSKTRTTRDVPIPRFLVEDLSVLMIGKSHEDLVFTNAAGGAVDNDNYRKRVFSPAVRRLAACDPSFPSGLTLHDLRHTAASLAISTGANVLAVQRMLGHESASMTLDVYAALFDKDVHAVADAFDALVQKDGS
ncbi:site-specific integrase [Corynebacterium sp. DSM 45110]|uniref:Site-specific integrase n=1 Tax=Corynebacterium suicordis DSM 45110 TaxID=1121369 RepID=A0ABR9ZH27_9CORY|nr:site-specific integrase [Corynebacterium suicordis DSM 45110]